MRTGKTKSALKKIPYPRVGRAVRGWYCSALYHDRKQANVHLPRCKPIFWLTAAATVQSLSRVQLFLTPWTAAHRAPLSMGFPKQEYWSGLPFPFPGNLPNPGTELGSPTWHADSLTLGSPDNGGFIVCLRHKYQKSSRLQDYQTTVRQRQEQAADRWFQA